MPPVRTSHPEATQLRGDCGSSRGSLSYCGEGAPGGFPERDRWRRSRRGPRAGGRGQLLSRVGDGPGDTQTQTCKFKLRRKNTLKNTAPCWSEFPILGVCIAVTAGPASCSPPGPAPRGARRDVRWRGPFKRRLGDACAERGVGRGRGARGAGVLSAQEEPTGAGLLKARIVHLFSSLIHCFMGVQGTVQK